MPEPCVARNGALDSDTGKSYSLERAMDQLDQESLLDEARRATGLDDFGAEDFREGLAMLVATYNAAPLSERGRRRNHRRLVELLSTRLRIEDAWRRHPEILQRRIARPMVLTGLPRSGTSALFSFLARDPVTRPLLLWEARNPDPLADLAPGQSDPRRDALEARFAEGRKLNPEFTKVHFASADTPEECVLAQAFALHGVQMGFEVMLEPYGSWYRGQDLHGLYAYYRDILKMLDWQRPGERWLLKAPAHMWAIDTLIDTFPDVSIVWSHRNPLLCVASICSMTQILMAPQMDVDKEQLGPVVMDFYATSLERGLAARDRADPARFVDVTHDDFVADSMAVAQRIYSHFGIDFTSAAQAAMAEHASANPRGKHGKHEYNLAEFGLGPDAVLARFASYVERFGIDTD
jgi:hypothetical protein